MPSASSGQKRVHIVQIKTEKNLKNSAQCEGLRPEELGALADAAELWRDHTIYIKKLQEIGSHLGLRALVFVYSHYNNKYALKSLPQPMDVAFEAVELDESDPSLVQLLTHLAEHNSDLQLQIKPNRIRRWILKSGFSWFMLFMIAIEVRRNLAQGLYHWTDWIWSVMYFGIMAVGMLVRRVFGGSWFVVPGGIFVRQRGATFWRRPMIHHTPERCVMVASPKDYGWLVTIYDGGKRLTKQVTLPELTFLLSAWQSDAVSPAPNVVRGFLGSRGSA